MEKHIQDMDLESLTEEEMREAARQYAARLMEAGADPRDDSIDAYLKMDDRSAALDHSVKADDSAEESADSGKSKKLLGKKNKDKDSDNDLSRLKKKDLLEIMLKQGEEIDSLRARIAELESQLADKNLKISESGSIAEASLALTKIFEEAQRAADLYLTNVKGAATGANIYK